MSEAILSTERGSVRVTREALSQFNPPEATRSWTPIKHSDLVDALHEEMARRGLEVRREQYAVQRQGNMLFGTLDLDWQDTGEYAAAIGLRTSNDKSMSIQLAVGARIFVCDNMTFSGDLIALKRRHTSKLNLPQELTGAIDRYQDGLLRLQSGIDRLKNTPLSVSEAKEMVFDIFRKKVVPIRLFHPVANAYRHAVREHGQNQWTLHNAFTEQVKTMPPGPAFRATTDLGKFFSLS